MLTASLIKAIHYIDDMIEQHARMLCTMLNTLRFSSGLLGYAVAFLNYLQLL